MSDDQPEKHRELKVGIAILASLIGLLLFFNQKSDDSAMYKEAPYQNRTH